MLRLSLAELLSHSVFQSSAEKLEVNQQVVALSSRLNATGRSVDHLKVQNSAELCHTLMSHQPAKTFRCVHSYVHSGGVRVTFPADQAEGSREHTGAAEEEELRFSSSTSLTTAAGSKQLMLSCSPVCVCFCCSSGSAVV